MSVLIRRGGVFSRQKSSFCEAMFCLLELGEGDTPVSERRRFPHPEIGELEELDDFRLGKSTGSFRSASGELETDGVASLFLAGVSGGVPACWGGQ